MIRVRTVTQTIVLLAIACALTLAASSCATGSQGPQNLAGEEAGASSGGDSGVESSAQGSIPEASADVAPDSGCGDACAQSCPGQLMACPGLGCIDTSADLKNCGQCGMVCAAPDAGGAKALCRNGQCVFSCPADAGPTVQACPGVGCVDVSKSLENCGACGSACATGQTCENGVCCGGTSKMCGGSCLDVSHDPSNCGDCGKTCATGGSCSGGKCVGYSITTPTPPATAADACTVMGHETLLVSAVGWEASAVVTLPIAFDYFGAPQTQFWIGSQGTMGFGPPPSMADGYPYCPLPDSYNSYGAIVPFGDSIDTGPSGVCYATTGTAPNRQMIVTWEQATHELDTGSILTFSVVLSETTNTIDLAYITATTGMDGGGYVRGNSATVGLQSPDGMSASQYACGTGSNDLYNAAPFAVHFAPLM